MKSRAKAIFTTGLLLRQCSPPPRNHYRISNPALSNDYLQSYSYRTIRGSNAPNTPFSRSQNRPQNAFFRPKTAFSAPIPYRVKPQFLHFPPKHLILSNIKHLIQ